MNDIYSNSSYILYKKLPKNIFSYTIILLLLFVLFLIIGNIKYNKYKHYKAIYHDGYIYYETDIIYDLKDLYINGKKYYYDVLSIDNNDGVYLVKIKCDLDSKWIKNDNYLDINFVYQKTSILNEVFKTIWKG